MDSEFDSDAAFPSEESKAFRRAFDSGFAGNLRASSATKKAQRIRPAAISPMPKTAGRAVSARLYTWPAFSTTRRGARTRATAVPRRAMASCRPMASAIGPSRNHLAMDRVTAVPAISLPSPKNMHPTYARRRDLAGA